MNQFVILFGFRAGWKFFFFKVHVHLLDSISSGLWSSAIVDSQSFNILMSLSLLRFALTFFISAVSVCCMFPRLSCLLTRHNDVIDAGQNNRLFALGTDMDRTLLSLSYMQKGIFYVQICDNKRLLHDIFHIWYQPETPISSPTAKLDMGRGLIQGTIWKISCHNLFISYFALTFFFQALTFIFELTNNLIEIRLWTYLYASSFLVLWDLCAGTGSWIWGQILTYEGKYVYLKANTDICLVFALRANNQHRLLAIIGHAKTNILQQNMW